MKNKKKISASEQRTLWGSRVVIWITMIVVLFPVIWIVMSSFSAGDSFFLSSLFPEKFSIEHYVELFRETDFGIWVFNSLKFCFIVAIIQLVLTSLAAYAFARLRFVGRKYGLMALLILQVFPNSMAVAGYYILIYKFGLVDNSFALILVLAGVLSIPEDVVEAAKIDGATDMQINMKIRLPLIRTIIGTCEILAATSMLREFELIYLTTNGGPGDTTLNLPLYLYKTSMTDNNYGYANMMGVILIIAGVIVVSAINRLFKMNEADY